MPPTSTLPRNARPRVLARLGSVVWLALACAVMLPAQPAKDAGAIIGRVGELPLREQEFLERLELLPPMSVRGRADSEFAKYEVLYSLVAEKLLSQEAVRRGFQRSEAFRESTLEIRKLYARDALYQDEVRDRIAVSEREIKEGMDRALIEVRIEYLYFERKEDAVFISRRLASAPRMALDSTLGAIRDTATVIFGDAVAPVEDAAYRLRQGQWSDVVSAGTGYYLLQAQSLRPSPYYTGLSPQDLREQVTMLLRRRKEQARAKEFVSEVLESKRGYGVRDAILALAESVSRVNRPEESYVSGALLEAVLNRLGQAARDTIAVAGDRSWTTAEFATRLYLRSYPLPDSSEDVLAGRINEELQLMVRQELLAQEGIRRKLDERPDVAARIRMWYDQQLAARMKQEVSESVHPGPSDAWKYLERLDTAAQAPTVTIRELVTPSMRALASAVDELESGQDFRTVIRRWSVGQTARTEDGLTGPFPITDRLPIGEIAWGMGVGERFGPVQEDTSYVIFELVAKQQMTAQQDTTGRFEEAMREVHRMMAQKATDVFIARLAQERGYEIYPERLNEIRSSGIPMMTYRFLGFGGRMFAVPLVDRQIDWLNADPGGVTLP